MSFCNKSGNKRGAVTDELQLAGLPEMIHINTIPRAEIRQAGPTGLLPSVASGFRQTQIIWEEANASVSV